MSADLSLLSPRPSREESPSVPADRPTGILSQATQGLIDVGREFHARGWSLGTSSNYSVVVQRDPLELLVTASGLHKEQLNPHSFARITGSGAPIDNQQPKSSAETMLHVVLAQQSDVGAVLHTHSVWCTVLSDIDFHHGAVRLAGYEMLKGLAGITTHETEFDLEIFENTQDIPQLAQAVKQRLHDPARPLRHAFLIRRHGLYTWGRDLAEARRHVEIIEFLLECVGRQRMLTR